MERIHPSQDEFKSSIEAVEQVLRNMDANVLQKINNDKDKSDQKVQEMEGSLGLGKDSPNSVNGG